MEARAKRIKTWRPAKDNIIRIAITVDMLTNSFSASGVHFSWAMGFDNKQSRKGIASSKSSAAWDVIELSQMKMTEKKMTSTRMKTTMVIPRHCRYTTLRTRR